MMNMKKIEEKSGSSSLEKGYRPVGWLNTQHPPQGGSGVPSKAAEQGQSRSTTINHK